MLCYLSEISKYISLGEIFWKQSLWNQWMNTWHIYLFHLLHFISQLNQPKIFEILSYSKIISCTCQLSKTYFEPSKKKSMMKFCYKQNDERINHSSVISTFSRKNCWQKRKPLQKYVNFE